MDLVIEVLTLQTLSFILSTPPHCSPIHVANSSNFHRWILCFLQEVQLWHFSPTLPSANISFVSSTGTTYLYSQIWNRLKYLVKFRAVFLHCYLALMFFISVTDIKKGFSAQRLFWFLFSAAPPPKYYGLVRFDSSLQCWFAYFLRPSQQQWHICHKHIDLFWEKSLLFCAV